MSAVANGAMICEDGVLRVQCVSEFIRRKFKSCLSILVVLIRGKYCVTVDLASLLHQRKSLFEG